MATAQLSYNGCDIWLTNISEWSDKLEAAREQRPLALQRGVYVPSALEGPRVLTIRGTLMSQSGDEDELRSQYEELLQSVAVTEAKWLYLWSDRRIKAICEDIRKINPAAWRGEVQMSFLCPDARWQDTAPTILEDSGGASGTTNQLLTFAIEREGTAPTEPLVRFVMNHPSNEIRNWTYHGPNLLTNSDFSREDSATQHGVPEDWVASDYGT